MTHSPRDMAVNPSDPTQRYIMWTNGRVDNIGNCPPITSHPDWSDHTEDVAMALTITDWTTGQGYILDYSGGFEPLNGAPNLAVDTDANGFHYVPGVPYTPAVRAYIDWSWDTAGTGQGYVMDVHGQLYAFGGASDPIRSGQRFITGSARRLKMQWHPTKMGITMDCVGGIFPEWAFVASSGGVGAPYWQGQDRARDVAISSWSAGTGYTLDMHGDVYNWGGAPGGVEPQGTRLEDSDVARCLHVLNATNPTNVCQVHSGGQLFDYFYSTAPTVVAGGDSTNVSPPSTVTSTTRPTLTWAYSDMQKDAQAFYQIAVFTQAFASAHTMTDPLVYQSSALVYGEGPSATTRGVVPAIDLANGTYRYYVRAQDSSGMWSAWANRGWTQNVAVPTTPSSMSAVPDATRWQINLSVGTSGSTATLVRFEYTDDGGITWAPVVGADRLPRLSVTTGVDYDNPLGVMRGYRAVQFSENPRTASSASAAVYTSGGRQVYVLTSTVDRTLGGEITVKDTPSWTREAVAGVFEGIGATYPVVVSDGVLRARKLTLGIETDGKPAWDAIEKLIKTGGTLVYRDPFGDVVYCRMVGTFGRDQVRKLPYPGETTALRHNHSVKIPLVEVAPPVAVS